MKVHIRIAIACLLLMIDSSLISAQSSTWFREYPLSYYVQSTAMTKLENGDLVFSGETNFFPRKISILRVNESGDTLWSRLLSGEYCSQITELNDNNLIIAGVFEGRALAVKISANGEVIWSRSYELGNGSSAFDAVYEDANMNLTFFGMSRFDSYTQIARSFWLRCTNSGDTLQLIQLIQSPGIGKVSLLPGNRYLLTAPLSIKGKALICNNKGSVERISENQFNIGVRDKVSTSYYFIRDSIQSGVPRSVFVEVVDSNFTEISDTLITIPGKTLYCSDAFGTKGGLLICGISIDNFTLGYSGFILSLNNEQSANWFRSYDIKDRIFRLQSVTMDVSGMIYSAGSMISDTNSNSNFCALKADQNGSITAVIHPPITLESTNKLSVEIFPNPFNGSIHVEVNISTDYIVKIEVYDVLGKRVSVPQTMLQMAGSYTYSLNNMDLIPSGSYFVVVTLKNELHTMIFTRNVVNLK